MLICEYHGALDDMFQLTHIAGPMIIYEPLHLFAGHFFYLFSQCFAKFVYEMPGKQGNILSSLSKGRHV